MRISADYVVVTVFNEIQAADACQQADAFANRIHVLLTHTVAPERLLPPDN